jgi:hypothetical protein
MQEKLQQLFKEELIKELRNVYIKYDKRTLVLFGDYRVEKTPDDLFQVSVADSKDFPIQSFNSVRTAVSYVVLHKNGDRDKQIDTLDLEIKIHTKIYRNADTFDRKGIYLTKLQTDYLRKKQVLEELKTVINKSKHKQRNIFDRYIKERKQKHQNFYG